MIVHPFLHLSIHLSICLSVGQSVDWLVGWTVSLLVCRTFSFLAILKCFAAPHGWYWLLFHKFSWKKSLFGVQNLCKRWGNTLALKKIDVIDSLRFVIFFVLAVFFNMHLNLHENLFKSVAKNHIATWKTFVTTFRYDRTFSF